MCTAFSAPRTERIRRLPRPATPAPGSQHVHQVPHQAAHRRLTAPLTAADTHVWIHCGRSNFRGRLRMTPETASDLRTTITGVRSHTVVIEPTEVTSADPDRVHDVGAPPAVELLPGPEL